MLSVCLYSQILMIHNIHTLEIIKTEASVCNIYCKHCLHSIKQKQKYIHTYVKLTTCPVCVELIKMLGFLIL